MANARKHKVILLGNVNVGKTSLFYRLKTNSFLGNKTSTTDVLYKDFDVNGKKVEIQLWDTMGVERFHSLTDAYYRGARAVIYVYSVPDMNSLIELARIDSDVQKSKLTGMKVLRFVIGNKIDLPRYDGHESDGVNFCAKINCDIDKPFLTSAMDGTGVQKAFETIARQLDEVPISEWTDPQTRATINPATPHSEKSKCCK